MKTLLSTFLIIIATMSAALSQIQNPHLVDQIKSLEEERDLIPAARKLQLTELALQIESQLKENGSADITFICTHNSRRSQLAEVWLRTAADYFKIKNISTFSEGTEATAFNQRMVDALVRLGFFVSKSGDEVNPVYLVSADERSTNAVRMFSKTYSDPFNPKENFTAVMVCDQADEACPIVPGAAYRLAIPYVDPKKSDNTTHESSTYDDKVKEIGREMIYVMSLVRREHLR